MRLVCPNCDAQYEVDDAAIPEAGRDVQCSNCGHAWFQLHPDALAEAELEAEVFTADEPSGPEADPLPASLTAGASSAAEAVVMADYEPDGRTGLAPDPEAEPPHRRAIDESVLAVLREEAERETAVRRAETPRAVETQSDLGLQQMPVPASVLAARERFKDLSTESDDHDSDDASARPSSRRELLPDIEEINSTLRASSEPRGDDEDDDVAPSAPVDDRRQGFRSGFMLMLLVAIALWTTYAMAPRIAEQFPASKPAMAVYVSAVNKARIGVDSALQSASKSLRSLSGQDG
jgi:predicted Zn finger-like uncharacterized protein